MNFPDIWFDTVNETEALYLAKWFKIQNRRQFFCLLREVIQLNIGVQNKINVDCIIIKLNLLHSVSLQSIAICILTHYNAPESHPLLTKIYVTSTNVVEMHY